MSIRGEAMTEVAVKDEVTVGQALGTVILPGSDILKTMLSGVFAILVLFLTGDSLAFPFDAGCDSIRSLQRVSLALILASLLFAIGSIASIYTIRNLRVNKLRSYWVIYRGKLLLDFAILIFFMVVCAWVIGLGGITRSPFSAFLCLSPAILLITWFNDQPTRYNEVYSALTDYRPKLATQAIHDRVRKVVRVAGFLPLVVVLLTLILGQVAVARFAVYKWFLGGELQLRLVLQTSWYYKVYYAIYALSAAVVIFGSIPTNYSEFFERFIPWRVSERKN